MVPMSRPPPAEGGSAGPTLPGLHHVTAITGDARGNLDFYTRVLGMRLVKKTVNQDDVSAYHLFYADADTEHAFESGGGGPGTEVRLVIPRQADRGHPGRGGVHHVAFRAPDGA